MWGVNPTPPYNHPSTATSIAKNSFGRITFPEAMGKVITVNINETFSSYGFNETGIKCCNMGE
jgi:hypothetical protein